MFGNPKLVLCCPGQEGPHLVNTVIPPADEGSAQMHSEGCCVCLGWKNDVFYVVVKDRKEGEMVGVVTRVMQI